MERARLWKASTTRTWSRKGRASRHGRQRIVQALSMRGAQVRATATATGIGAWSTTPTGVVAPPSIEDG